MIILQTDFFFTARLLYTKINCSIVAVKNKNKNVYTTVMEIDDKKSNLG